MNDQNEKRLVYEQIKSLLGITNESFKNLDEWGDAYLSKLIREKLGIEEPLPVSEDSDLPEPEHCLTVEEAKEKMRQIAVQYPEYASRVEDVHIWTLEAKIGLKLWDDMSNARRHAQLTKFIQHTLEEAILYRQQMHQEEEERRRKTKRKAKRQKRLARATAANP